MRIVVDHNLPARLVRLLSGWSWIAKAEHTTDLGWASADDRTIWSSLSREASMVLTKDKDFGALSATLGFPPKVVSAA